MPAPSPARSAAAAFLFLLFSTPGLAADRTVTVSGEGVANARPDMATLSLGVLTQAPTAGEALAANSQEAGGLIERLEAEGIEAKDIQTSNLSLQPVLAYPKADDGNAGPPKVTGYTASNMVTVRVRTLATLGTVLDKAVAAGANTVSGIEFLVSNESRLLDDARRQAVQDARRKAELYAEAAGARLGPVVTLSEQSAPPPPRPMYRMEAAAAAVPVEAGESQLKIGVSITYALQ
jgi:uncharacterized protein